MSAVCLLYFQYQNQILDKHTGVGQNCPVQNSTPAVSKYFSEDNISYLSDDSFFYVAESIGIYNRYNLWWHRTVQSLFIQLHLEKLQQMISVCSVVTMSWEHSWGENNLLGVSRNIYQRFAVSRIWFVSLKLKKKLVHKLCSNHIHHACLACNYGDYGEEY